MSGAIMNKIWGAFGMGAEENEDYEEDTFENYEDETGNEDCTGNR